MDSPEGIRFIDLFCGIGGFRIAALQAAANAGLRASCVFSSDIDKEAQDTYEANFGHRPSGDIRSVDAAEIPEHDLLFAGFPCQPFSIIGDMKGFLDERGTLFHDIHRILSLHRPSAFVLENVKQLRGHDEGRTLKHIMHVLTNELGYQVQWEVLNALDFGLPQKRERIVIVGFRDKLLSEFEWPQGGYPMRPLRKLLEPHESVSSFYFASEAIRQKRATWHSIGEEPTIWHENKSGNISKLHYSCALRAGASYNYLLVDGIRRMTEREMLRLQGFPENYKIACGYSATRKQAGNSVPVPMIQAVIERVLDALCTERAASPRGQLVLQMERGRRQYQ